MSRNIVCLNHFLVFHLDDDDDDEEVKVAEDDDDHPSGSDKACKIHRSLYLKI